MRADDGGSKEEELRNAQDLDDGQALDQKKITPGGVRADYYCAYRFPTHSSYILDLALFSGIVLQTGFFERERRCVSCSRALERNVIYGG